MPATDKFRTSETVAQVATALVRAQGSFPRVRKNKTNSAHGNQYAELGEMIQRTRKPLAANGLAVLQVPTSDLEKEEITITTRLQHESGEWMESDFTLPIFEEEWAKDNVNGQVVVSAVSYARRCAYASMLAIATADDDGNAACQIPPDYKRTDGKRPGVHIETAKGELLEVREGNDTGVSNGWFARMAGMPHRLWIRDDGIRLQLSKAVREVCEL